MASAILHRELRPTPRGAAARLLEVDPVDRGRTIKREAVDGGTSEAGNLR
jgi:hypothetical protein